MFNCKELVDALNNNYNGSYANFEESIIIFVENYMMTLSKDKHYFPTCLIKENCTYLGMAIDTEKIILNKNIIKKLMNGDKKSLIPIFHELSHIEQNIQIKNGVSTPNIIKYIKDTLLDEYQEEENKRFGIYMNNIFSFYNINYQNYSKEIDATLNSILLTIEFFIKNNIDYTNEEKYLNNYFNETLERKKNKRNLTHCITFNSYYLTLDKAFDVAIKYHPEWLERYPQLKLEYCLNNGKVIKKETITYPEYNESSDKYHKVKHLILNKNL